MKKLCLFAAVAGLTLVSASPPASSDGSASAASTYPPCSKTVTDRCIQPYERGVARKGEARMAARGGPYEAAPAASAGGDYPPCSATVRDRCNQLKSRPVRAASHHRIRAAGERG